MILTMDVGNSNIVLGGYYEGKIGFLARMTTERRLEADQYAVQLKSILELYGAHREPVEQISMASVVPGLTPVLLRALGHLYGAKPHLLSLADCGGMEIDIENPGELGTDVLASAIAVRHTRRLPAVIIDMGTATKLTALDAEGTLRGVAISPGLFVSLDALVQGTSTLSNIPLEAPQAAIGRNTAESMKSGVVLGTAAMLDGMVDRFAAQMGGVASIVATGGVAPVVAPHCRHEVEVCETLLLDGLYRAVAGRQAE